MTGAVTATRRYQPLGLNATPFPVEAFWVFTSIILYAARQKLEVGIAILSKCPKESLSWNEPGEIVTTAPHFLQTS